MGIITNEKLALRLQAGSAEAFEQLVEQNKGILHRQTWRLWYSLGQHESIYGLEFADAEQLALMGLYRASMAYEPAKGFLLTSYLRRQVSLAFRDFHGAQRKDALSAAVSADEPRNGENGDLTLLDILPDDSAQEDLQVGEEWEFKHHLRSLLDTSIDELPDMQSDSIRRHYLDGETQVAIAQACGVTWQAVSQRIQCGLQGLRDNPRLQGYSDEYIGAQAYRGTGLRAFKERGGSSAERLIERQEERARKRAEREEQQLRAEAEEWLADVMSQAGMS